MDVLFFAFANDPQEPLPTLQREVDELRRLLSPGELQQRYIIHFDPFATREKISYYLTLYRDHIAMFHYSGHAGRDALFSAEEASHAQGIAQLLGQCPKLSWVILNGCSTAGQVKLLLEQAVPSGVIATHAPVEDKKATDFAIRFYQSLANQETVDQSFELAKGEILTQAPDTSFTHSTGFSNSFSLEETELWACFVKEGHDSALEWKLPSRTAPEVPADFEPNILLIDTLVESLAPYAREVRNIKRDEEDGEEIDTADKRLAILNSMPAPIAEQLRKLMVPFTDKSKGYDKISEARVEQLVKTYNTIIELFTYTMLAQLWEAKENQENLEVSEEQKNILRAFFRTFGPERELYDFLPLMKALGEILESHGINYFIEELSQLKNRFDPQSEFVYASHFLNSLRRRVERDDLASHEVADACVNGEKQLSTIFTELGFLAKYTMTAVRMIDVVKFRHFKTPKFRHTLVKLVKVMGGLEEKHEDLDQFMDSRSVLLLKKGKDKTDYLNLSPFVIDQNAFDDKLTDISKVYFFYSYDQGIDKYSFRHVDKPDDMPLIVSRDQYPMIQVQFDAFSEMIFQQPMTQL